MDPLVWSAEWRHCWAVLGYAVAVNAGLMGWIDVWQATLRQFTRKQLGIRA